MSKAAYCSQCGANVYVTEDGRCPQGHGPEFLSGYYDVSEPSSVSSAAPAEPARPAAGSDLVRTASKGAGAVLIALAILVVFLIGCCAVSGTWLLREVDEMEAEDLTSGGEVSGDPEEDSYFEEMNGITTSVNEALELLSEAYPANSDEDVEKAARAVDLFDESYAAALEIEPPMKYQAIHDYWIGGIHLFTEAGAMMRANGFRESGDDRAQEIDEVMLEACDEWMKASDAIDALDEVW